MNDSMFGASLQSKGISQIIVERIVSSVILGELKPGDKLPTEQEFSERTGAGKSSVREAVKILEAFGVVEIRRGKGAFLVEGFNEAMLTPTLLGIMLSEHDTGDALDFHERIIIMVLMGINHRGMSAAAAERASAVLSDLGGTSDGQAILTSIRRTEDALISFEANPLMRVLAQQALRFTGERVRASVSEAGSEKSILEMAQKALSALRDGDIDKVVALLDGGLPRGNSACPSL